MHDFSLETKLAYLPGVGDRKADLLAQELQLVTWSDLLHYYPFRHEDRSQRCKIRDVYVGMSHVQLQGTITHVRTIQSKQKRLLARFQDDTGEIVLVWLQGLPWILKKLKLGEVYTAFGKPASYGQRLSLVHPELERWTPNQQRFFSLFPVYHTTEKLKSRFLDSKALARLQRHLWGKLPKHIVETLPAYLLERHQLLDRFSALRNVHFPESHVLLQKARERLKFEELFYLQWQWLALKQPKIEKYPGKVLSNTQLLRQFYDHHLLFALTSAQKRVIKEIYQDLRSGRQMNRLIQGDVGSGKTIVAFLSMLICIGSGSQVAMMAPTEILAEQHYKTLQGFAAVMNLTIALLTGTTKKKTREALLTSLEDGSLQMVVGTHALLNTGVRFHDLGLAVIDEQHRFGVAQRARLWAKRRASFFPHVLVMTATPIPRTLAMTLYGDLATSIIDEMPAGRKPIITIHHYDAQRLKVLGLLRRQLAAGRQVYVVYPLIEESEKLAYHNLMDGYESICRAFPAIPIGVMHGQMHAVDKEYEMQRFVSGSTKIMVTTTVIEVGVNVPNATVMVIENAERFGLAQLHQLRGRVGRGSTQAYCVLMTANRLSARSKERIQTLLRTTDGFEIADVDLKLRGPGDLLGVQQSGLLDLKIADLRQDGQILQLARTAAERLIEEDPSLNHPIHLPIKRQLSRLQDSIIKWSSVS